MGKDREYLFSIIMAVYNEERYLKTAVKSLLRQTIGFRKNVQLILVNDGSTDMSGEICDTLAKRYPKNIIALHQKNAGAANARNYGLSFATGTLLNFMDADDKISRHTLKEIASFFEKEGERIDVACIPLVFFDGDKGPHWQNWKFDKGTRVIDLVQEPETTCMSTASSFIHRRRIKDIVFDDRLMTGEDAKVLLAVLQPKQALGVVSEATYYYRREKGGNSLIQSAPQKKEWYLNFIPYHVNWAYEYYKEKEGNLPSYVQYNLLCDYQWRLIQFSDTEEILTSQEQIKYEKFFFRSLNLFEDKYIVAQKIISTQQKRFLLYKKYVGESKFRKKENDYVVSYGKEGKEKWLQSEIPLEIAKFQVYNQRMAVYGKVRVFSELVKEFPEVQLIIMIGVKQIPCETFCNNGKRAPEYKGGVQEFYFNTEIPIDGQENSLEFLLKTNSFCIPLQILEYSKMSPFTNKLRHAYYYKKPYLIIGEGRKISVSSVSFFDAMKKELLFLWELFFRFEKSSLIAVVVRLIFWVLRPFIKKPIYLISDRVSEAGDNGEALFHYLNENTTIRPFFAIDKKSSDYARLKEKGKIIPFNGFLYKLLSLFGAYIISSHAEDYIYTPFYHSDYYANLLEKRSKIFLQHGVILHDLSDWLNQYEKDFTLFFATTQQEYLSFLKPNYGYTEKEIKLTGMPRYDLLTSEPQPLITIMPTWRRYLTSGTDPDTGDWVYREDFKESQYYHFYNSLINHPQLLKVLDETGYRMQFRPHPNAVRTVKDFDIPSQITILSDKDSYATIFKETSLLITDYSSVAFDFAYLKKPIVYCHFDREEFFSGRQQYRKGYFDYEKDGFGEVAYNVEESVQCIVEYLMTGCQTKPLYQSRIEQTFIYHDKKNSERVFNEIAGLES